MPVSFKAAFGLMLSIVMAAWFPHLPPIPANPFHLMVDAIAQISCGAMLGLTMQVILSGISAAGEIMGLSLGVNFAQVFNPSASAEAPIVYDLMYWIGLMAYLAAGGPFWLIAALAHSFVSMPSGLIAGPGWNDLALFGADLFKAAVWMAMPVMAASVAVNLITGLANTMAPQLNIFSVGFPLMILVGIYVLMISIGNLPPLMNSFTHQASSLALSLHSATPL